LFRIVEKGRTTRGKGTFFSNAPLDANDGVASSTEVWNQTHGKSAVRSTRW